MKLRITKRLNVPNGTPLTVNMSNDVDAFAEMDPEERAAFVRELDASCAEADAGNLIDAADVLASLRAST